MNTQKTWWARRDLNPHALRHKILSLAKSGQLLGVFGTVDILLTFCLYLPPYTQ